MSKSRSCIAERDWVKRRKLMGEMTRSTSTKVVRWLLTRLGVLSLQMTDSQLVRNVSACDGRRTPHAWLIGMGRCLMATGSLWLGATAVATLTTRAAIANIIRAPHPGSQQQQLMRRWQLGAISRSDACRHRRRCRGVRSSWTEWNWCQSVEVWLSLPHRASSLKALFKHTLLYTVLIYLSTCRQVCRYYLLINLLESKSSYSATSMGGLLHLVQRAGYWAGPQPAQAHSRCTKCDSPPINGQCNSLPIYSVTNCCIALRIAVCCCVVVRCSVVLMCPLNLGYHNT